MEKTSFTIDGDLLQQIADLKRIFRVKTDGEALKKAIELATVVGKRADESNNVIIAGKDNLIKLDLGR